jgi:large subunit ribosomal protein L17
MRHRKHRHTLGVKKEHRAALMANLAAALFRHGRIETTLAKARALRPFAEKLITMAVKAERAEDPARKVHYLRLAMARVRDKEAVFKLFNERVAEFTQRPGGYTRIYKLVPRTGDAADMALIELIEAGDEGYSKPKSGRKRARKNARAADKPTEAAATAAEAGESTAATGTATAEAEPASDAEAATDEAGESAEPEKKEQG